MKKLFLSVVAVFLTLFAAFSQTTGKDTAEYKSRKLTFDEANFVTSYYHQDGNNSAVTGGIGTEKLTDLSGAFDIKLTRWDKSYIKHSFDLEIGIDHYTSASSDKVDPHTISSASYADTRIYPSVNWTMENLKKGIGFGAGLSFSNEFDYKSFGANVNFSKKTNDRNGEFIAKAQAYFDKVSLIYPIELRTGGSTGNNDDEHNYPSTPRNSYSGSLSYSQIINQHFQLMLIAEIVKQQGYLGLPFHRVYFTDNSVHVENLPDNRLKIPLGIRANYFLGDKFILRSFYRYYQDDWGLSAHTAQIETSVKVTPFFSVTPFYRYYTQNAVDYFAPYKVHTAADQFYTSNYDLSKFNSNFYGAGIRMAPPKGLFGNEHFNALEIRYGHYSRSNGLSSDIITLSLKIK